jgi:hypothetical protein
MKHLLPLFLILLPPGADSVLIVTDFSYTHDSLSFRLSGDLTGYPRPARAHSGSFSVQYVGDILAKPVVLIDRNSWSKSLFQGHTIEDPGFTGSFSWSWAHPGSWIKFSPDLTNTSVASGDLVTLNFGDNTLNDSATTGEFVFSWGIDQNATSHTEVARISVSAIPELSSTHLVSVGFSAMLIFRRRRLARLHWGVEAQKSYGPNSI